MYFMIMGISKKLLDRFRTLTPDAQKRLSRMCWSDKVTVREIEKQFLISANEIEKFMRFYLSEKDFKRWVIRSKNVITFAQKKLPL